MSCIAAASESSHTPRLKRHLGQHLLVSNDVIASIIKAADFPSLLLQKAGNQTEERRIRVLEIGSGTGNLTAALLDVDPTIQVHGVECDASMVKSLEDRFPSQLRTSQLQLHVNRIEKLRLSDLFSSSQGLIDAVVANIPYQLSSLIIARLVSYLHKYPGSVKCIILLLQEEFAQRMLATPHNQNYGRLAVNTSLVGHVDALLKVGPEVFIPRPQVDSRVIKVTPHFPRFIRDPSFLREFDALLRICFLRKNKTLRALLTSKSMERKLVGASDWKKNVLLALKECDLIKNRAVQTSKDDFLRLFGRLEQVGIRLLPTVSNQFDN
uniref:rRNA adenine N(6)-methyltransferase n=1 Tax=Albugo laibachii Nc14 TaxID=890382 RepID=F0WIC8_9STRA|nr:dimethyladenosine transferase putative [Albugo laibachii Nc14]|eukprot:CCA21009.1 dimethyladenosine transferase putative [Albugo laibachii Nc14]